MFWVARQLWYKWRRWRNRNFYIWAVLHITLLLVGVVIVSWFTYDIWHYWLTTPACQRNGTC